MNVCQQFSQHTTRNRTALFSSFGFICIFLVRGFVVYLFVNVFVPSISTARHCFTFVVSSRGGHNVSGESENDTLVACVGCVFPTNGSLFHVFFVVWVAASKFLWTQPSPSPLICLYNHSPLTYHNSASLSRVDIGTETTFDCVFIHLVFVAGFGKILSKIITSYGEAKEIDAFTGRPPGAKSGCVVIYMFENHIAYNFLLHPLSQLDKQTPRDAYYSLLCFLLLF